VSDFDAVVVGAGPAGTTAALAMARAGARVALLERGEWPGAKNMFGGMLVACETPERLIPGFWDEAPWERHVTKRVLTVVGPESSTSLAHESKSPDSRPYAGFTLYRPVFDRWYAERARDAGVTLLCSCTVEGLVVRGGRVCGVRVAGREDGVVEAPVVIAADGVVSLLAKEAGLHDGFKPRDLALGVRALFLLEEEEIDRRLGLRGREGATYEYLGCTEGVRGGAFVYTQLDSLSVGVVVHLDALAERRIAPYELLEGFIGSASVAPLLQGARLAEYSAHLLPEGGAAMLPRRSAAGFLVAGDAGALCYTNGLTFEGMNLAMASAELAARVAVDAVGAGNVSAERLSAYDALLADSFVMKDLKTWKRAGEFLKRDQVFTLYPELIEGLMEGIYRSDGRPKRRVAHLGLDVVTGKVSWRQLLKDGIAAGRSYL
jgi:electron transfer flavoprotein-quinone oxidoreductase